MCGGGGATQSCLALGKCVHSCLSVWCSLLICSSDHVMQASKVVFNYIKGDLPWDVQGMVHAGSGVTIAHCVSADVAARKWASAGVAAALMDTYDIRHVCKRAVASAGDKLAPNGHLHIGSVLVVTGVLNGKQIRIINLITKATYYTKPQKSMMRDAFDNFATYLDHVGCKEVAISLLGCGRDGKRWSWREGEPRGNGEGVKGVFCVQDLLEAWLGMRECLFHVVYRPVSIRGKDTCERGVQDCDVQSLCFGTILQVHIVFQGRVTALSNVFDDPVP